MQIGGLQKLTLIDYPGKIACTIFTIGCPFRCPFCYSSELVIPNQAKKIPKLPEQLFFDFLRERKGFLDAVVICGGEPTIHKDLPIFISKIKKLGFLVKLDTNGNNPEMLQNLIDKKLINYVAMDIKGPKEKYSFFSGTKNLNILNIEKSIQILFKTSIPFEFRTTVCPGLIENDFINIANWLGGFGRSNYFLQTFESRKKIINPKILKHSMLAQAKHMEIIKKIGPSFKSCQTRG